MHINKLLYISDYMTLKASAYLKMLVIAFKDKYGCFKMFHVSMILDEGIVF